MPASSLDPAEILRRGSYRGIPIEPFGPVWDTARLRLSRAAWQVSNLEPFLNFEVPYVSTSSGRLSDDAVTVALAARPGECKLRVLELGSGSGLFARLFLDALQRRAPDLYAGCTYVVSDGSASILAAQSESRIHDHHRDKIEPLLLDLSQDWPEIGQFDLILGSYILDSLPFDFLAVKDSKVWRREMRAVFPPEQAAMAENLRQALEDGSAEALRPYLPLGPQITTQTRHAPVDRASLPQSAAIPDDTEATTLPYIHCYGALDCLDRCIAHLAPGGVAIFSDYGHIQPYEARETPEFQAYGSSVAAGLNFPQLDAVFSARAGLAYFKPDIEDGHLYTRVFQRSPAVDLTDLVADLYGALRYRALTAPVEAARELMRGRLYESSRKLYATALEAQPHNWALMQEIALTFFLMTEEHDEALELAEMGLALNPLSPDLWRVKAEANLALDRIEEAQAAIAKAVSLAPQNVAAQLALARIALRQDHFTQALRAIATALAHDLEGDSQDALIALQTEALAKIAKRELDKLTAATNPFRALDKLPES